MAKDASTVAPTEVMARGSGFDRSLEGRSLDTAPGEGKPLGCDFRLRFFIDEEDGRLRSEEEGADGRIHRCPSRRSSSQGLFFQSLKSSFVCFHV